MKLNKEQEAVIRKFGEELEEGFEKRMNKYPTYTHEELNAFEKKGIMGEVCMCPMKIANTMTIECVICGKVQMRFAKAFLRRQKLI